MSLQRVPLDLLSSAFQYLAVCDWPAVAGTSLGFQEVLNRPTSTATFRWSLSFPKSRSQKQIDDYVWRTWTWQRVSRASKFDLAAYGCGSQLLSLLSRGLPFAHLRTLRSEGTHAYCGWLMDCARLDLFPNLTRLDIKQVVPWHLPDFYEALCHLPQLEALVLDQGGIPAGGPHLAYLCEILPASMTELDFIDLDPRLEVDLLPPPRICAAVAERDTSRHPLAKFSRLRKLSVERLNIQDGAAAHCEAIGRLPSLTDLVVVGSCTLSDLHRLLDSETLQTARCALHVEPSRDDACHAQSPALRVLSLEGHLIDEVGSLLEGMPALENLAVRLEAGEFAAHGLRHIADGACATLRVLSVEYPLREAYGYFSSFEVLPRLARLEELDLGLLAPGKSREFCKTIAQLSQLRVLGGSLGGDTSDEDLIQHIGRLTRLESLTIGRTQGAAACRLTDAGLAGLWRLTALTDLDLYACPLLTNDATRHIAKNHPRLRSLGLEECPQLTDAALLPLASLQHLKTLNVSGSSIEARGLQALRHLARLEALELNGCTALVMSAASVWIRRIASLQVLWLMGVPAATDAVVARLESKKLRVLRGFEDI